MSDLVERIEKILWYMEEGIYDERDSVLLQEMRRAWSEVRLEIERLRDEVAGLELLVKTMVDAGYARMREGMTKNILGEGSHD